MREPVDPGRCFSTTLLWPRHQYPVAVLPDRIQLSTGGPVRFPSARGGRDAREPFSPGVSFPGVRVVSARVVPHLLLWGYVRYLLALAREGKKDQGYLI